jgi:hypothetical protein
LPSRKTLAKEHIPALAEEANSSSTEFIHKAERVNASSDGWRKKEYEHGAALNDVMALLHGRAVFHDAINASAKLSFLTAPSHWWVILPKI